ncbi:hypothetical protein JHK85_054236 [Glycine max]|uniref:Uncharacterized protein n=1 Tax=Glycine soja TaxID=3848 RepID=A0A0B2PMP0_GLYSO|nr:hypothetical protein JHK87_053368 [Glycine soja]KAG4927750.1 hypothetical protein JHK85_054236 [Glycine max]KHN08908.1 hypothetical protein glysoja_029485 [Glycine soja]
MTHRYEWPSSSYNIATSHTFKSNKQAKLPRETTFVIILKLCSSSNGKANHDSVRGVFSTNFGNYTFFS